jgi:phytoene desaturase
MSQLDGTDVVVVGAGFGGLSAACFLADEGASVTVLEKNDQLGGRASVLETEGFRFDMGPSWYMMPDVFERFFAKFDHEPADFYDLEPLDPHYEVFFKDGDHAAMRGDREHVRDLFESYEDGAGDAVIDYLDTSAEHYETAMTDFVYEDRHRWRDWLDPALLRATPTGLTLLGSMEGYTSKYFDHPKLRQLVQYTLVFLGGSPSNTPALYNIMGHVDVDLGVYYPAGGLASVVDALVTLGDRLGATYETGAEVTSIERTGDGMAVETGNGRTFAPDAVVSNADYAHTELALQPETQRGHDADYWEERTYAPSAYICYLGVEGEVDPLAHHTLVLPTDWSRHFEEIFDDPAWPDDPAYYVCVPSATDPDVAPEGHSTLFVLVPIAPGLDDDQATRDAFREALFADLAEHTGVDLRDRIVLQEEFSVSEFGERYNATEGTALGLAHTLRQTGPLRPAIRSSGVDGLYFAGGFTTPGIGVPMCIISGEQAAAAVVEGHGEPA